MGGLACSTTNHCGLSESHSAHQTSACCSVLSFVGFHKSAPCDLLQPWRKCPWRGLRAEPWHPVGASLWGARICYFLFCKFSYSTNGESPGCPTVQPTGPLIRRDGMRSLAGCLLTGPGLHGPGSWRGSAGRSSLSLRMSCSSGSPFLPRCSPNCSPQHSPQRTKQARRGSSLKAMIETVAIAVACLAGAPQPGHADMFGWMALQRGCVGRGAA